MNFPFHLFQLKSTAFEHENTRVHVTTRTNVQWDKPVFRAPALPSTSQFHNELPFTVNFPRNHPTAR